jgi:Flp pilus assembly pilin Flp
MNPITQCALTGPWRREEGQDLLEYALLVALVVIVAIGAVDLLGSTLKTVFWDGIAARF